MVTMSVFEELAVRNAQGIKELEPPMKTEFRNWLLNLPETRRFVPHHSEECPFAQWYADKGLSVAVLYHAVVSGDPCNRFSYPIAGTWIETVQRAWMDALVQKRFEAAVNHEFTIHLTRDEVLEVLDRQMGYA